MIVLAIPDMHHPFVHPKFLDFIKKQRDRWKPDRVVCMGDELDHCAVSHYDKDPDGMSAGDEYTQAIKSIQPWYKEFPKVDVVESNHGSRPFKLAFKAGLPKAFLRDYHEFSKAPAGWKWHSTITLDDTLYLHGEPFAGKEAARRAVESHGMSCVIGHIHSYGGVSYVRNQNGLLFGLNAGCGIDEQAYAFKYAKVSPHRPTLGCGVVIDGEEAHFIPMRNK